MMWHLSQFKNALTQEDKDKLLNLDFSRRDDVWGFAEHIEDRYKHYMTLRIMYHLAIELGVEELQ